MKIETMLLPALAAFGLVCADAGVDFEVEFLNRYVDLGENVEPGTRFLRVGAGTELHGIHLGLEAFQALGSGDYNEVSAAVSHDLEMGGLLLTPGFTWLWFPDDSEDTAEVSLRFELPLVPPLMFFGEFAFDLFDSEGFLEAGLALPRSVQAGEFEIEITPSVTFGFDYGMVSGERDFKENNITVALEMNVPVTDQLDAFAGINQSYAMGALEDEGGRDVSWFGLGVALGF